MLAFETHVLIKTMLMDDIGRHNRKYPKQNKL